MYDLSSKFNAFYKEHVVLGSDEVKKLYSRKNLNLDRLKNGLKEYNEEKNTNYKIVDDIVQGSVAMATVSQSDQKDYDIDVAIIFEKGNIPDGTISVKNIVVNALKKKCNQFSSEPEAKTNCVRIVYSEGYHIDFAIYRRFKNPLGKFEYEHCGSEWRQRNPRTITNWFKEKNKQKNYKLSKIVRLLKMFCKSRSSWDMPGGLILTVLAEECFKSDQRLDISFYNTIKAIKDRLAFNTEVKNPVETNISLLLTEKDRTRIENLSSRLITYIDKISILFNSNCTEKQAVEAWNDFFNHTYWSQLLNENAQIAKTASASLGRLYDYDDTEEFIEEQFPVELLYKLQIDCEVTQPGWRTEYLRTMLNSRQPLRINKKLKFFITKNDVPNPYQIYWKVRNLGDIAEQKNCLRGQIVEGKEERKEETSFRGPHYVECYIIKDGICVAKDRIDVPISTI